MPNHFHLKVHVNEVELLIETDAELIGREGLTQSQTLTNQCANRMLGIIWCS